MILKKRMIMRIILLSVFSSYYLPHVSAQNTYKVESGACGSHGDYTPLWLNAKKQGVSSIEKNNAYIDAGVFKNTDNRKFSYGYGVELIGAHNFTSDVFVQQAYLDLKYKALQLSLGSKERNGELTNQELSSGGLAYSGNAHPLPQVRLEAPDYITIPYTKKWLSFRGQISYGWFTDGNWQKRFAGKDGNRMNGTLYHSHALFFKVEHRDVMPLKIEGGLEVYNEFGGTRHYNNGEEFKMPEGLGDYLRVLFDMKGGRKTPESDQINKEGNSLGCYHLSVTYYGSNWEIRPYYEHYFEDRSQASGKYPWHDGLIGLDVKLPKNPIVSNLLVEYFGTMDQTGTRPFVGEDDYYNNGFYDSWSNWGQAEGNPLLISPIYNKNRSLMFQDNRITARHIGFSGSPVKDLSYRFLYSYTRNWGRYVAPYTTVRIAKCQLLELTYQPHQLKGWKFTLSEGTDRGDMFGRNTGMMFTVTKSGRF